MGSTPESFLTAYDELQRRRREEEIQPPDTDGIELARVVRAHSNVPILMMTGRTDVASRIEGLDAGADDYLPKPFDVGELSARIRGLLRRSQIERRAKTVAVQATSSCRRV